MLLPLAALMIASGCAAGTQTAPAGQASYEAWVASESVDQVAQIRFDGREAGVVARRPVGVIPVELEGPHGIAISPDGDFVYVTLGHGLPNGSLWKLDAKTGRVAGRTPLGLFPATVSLTPNGEYAFVSNFNLHGDHVPSSISMVRVSDMVEVARTETCVMPHGSRVNRQGTRHYSVCMMDELLVELDARTGTIERMFSVRRGQEGPVDHTRTHAMGGGSASGATPEVTPGTSSGLAGAGTPSGLAPSAGAQGDCSPTWAEPSVDGTSVFVTCNRAREVLEVDVETWRIVRRFATGENPYNLAVSPDGRWLLVSLRNRTDPAVEIFSLSDGTMAGRVPTSTTLAHGIAVTGDSRYAFVTVEGVGSEPGKVDVIDLTSFRRVASVEVGQQATGIATVPTAR